MLFAVSSRKILHLRKKLVLAVFLLLLFVTVEAQKGAFNLSAGPLVSLPLQRRGIPSYHTGLGLEAGAQYNVKELSSILLQASVAGYKVDYSLQRRSSISSLKVGYRYSFNTEGFFLNALVGTDIEGGDNFLSVTLGGGYRFSLGEKHFIDAGVDYIDGDTETRVNIKAAISLFRWGRKE